MEEGERKERDSDSELELSNVSFLLVDTRRFESTQDARLNFITELLRLKKFNLKLCSLEANTLEFFGYVAFPY